MTTQMTMGRMMKRTKPAMASPTARPMFTWTVGREEVGNGRVGEGGKKGRKGGRRGGKEGRGKERLHSLDMSEQ